MMSFVSIVTNKYCLDLFCFAIYRSKRALFGISTSVLIKAVDKFLF